MFFDCKYLLEKEKELKPCPFCNTDMSVIGQRIWHPPFDCILYSFSFRDTRLKRQSWNRRAEEWNEQDSPEEKKKAYIVWLNDGHGWSFSNIFHKRDQAEFFAKDAIRRSQNDDIDENWTEFEIEERNVE